MQSSWLPGLPLELQSFRVHNMWGEFMVSVRLGALEDDMFLIVSQFGDSWQRICGKLHTNENCWPNGPEFDEARLRDIQKKLKALVCSGLNGSC